RRRKLSHGRRRFLPWVCGKLYGNWPRTRLAAHDPRALQCTARTDRRPSRWRPGNGREEDPARERGSGRNFATYFSDERGGLTALQNAPCHRAAGDAGRSLCPKRACLWPATSATERDRRSRGVNCRDKKIKLLGPE